MPNWAEVLNQINGFRAAHAAASKQAVDHVRRQYLGALHKHTGRNVIAYYSGFLSKPEIPSEINDEDKNGFMMAVHKLDRTLGLDLIIHTPGGGVAAVQSLADYLHKMFQDNIKAIVPQIAMSAGTMLACSCKMIWMTKHANLGPIDPHLRVFQPMAPYKNSSEHAKKLRKMRARSAYDSQLLVNTDQHFLGSARMLSNGRMNLFNVSLRP